MLTVQSVQSDVAGSYRPYDDMSGDDVASNCWLAAIESGSDMCPLVANGVRTRGPIRGRHVSLIVWFMVVCKIMGVCGVRPPDLPHYVKPSQTSADQCARMVLVIYVVPNIFKFV
jgi:hypothetical protein